MRIWLGVACAAMLGCVNSNSQTCMDGRTCPRDTVCDEVHALCVNQAQFDECAGQPDGTSCALPVGTGTCDQMVCLNAVCGDGRVEPPEACDDGNTFDEDTTAAVRCSADCRSTEVCGNGIIDLKVGETCDDGNLLDHDGCSSTCQPETLAWQQFSDPGLLQFATAAYDVSRGKLVLFGGQNGSVTNGDTAEWDGVWRAHLPVLSPAILRQGALAYFGPHHAVILEGGGNGGGPTATTWEWNGVVWKRLVNGPVRQEHVLVYDSKRQRLVLFGGNTGGEDPSDTWEFDGTTWSEITTPTAPPGRTDAVAAYDPQRNVVVMFGGKNTNGDLLNDTWEYDGHTWTDRTLAMPVIVNPAMTYSTKLHGIVMYGGFVGATAQSTLYVWNGTTWASSATPMPARGAHIMVEVGRGALLVYGGGVTGGGVLQDTWIFDGVMWSQITANPMPRMSFGVVTTKDRVVLFGGNDTTAVLPAETWELTGFGWKRFAGGTSPGGTSGVALAYDEAHDTVVMFGGQKAGNTLDDTTWKRANSVWSSTHPSPSPSPRTIMSLTYDPAHKQTVLFGGALMSGFSNETWTFDGTTWTQHTPAHAPPVRAGAAMVFDRVNGLVVLHGGVSDTVHYDDTWVWDGTDWTEVSPGGEPPPKYVFPGTAVWSPFRHSVLVFGGLSNDLVSTMDAFELAITPCTSSDLVACAATWQWTQLRELVAPPFRFFQGAFLMPDRSTTVVLGGSDAAVVLGDQWGLRLEGSRPHDACQLPIDVDGDGKVLCDDPDCWTVCTPLCPPASSCPAHSAGCGDGICDGTFETCHNCPHDCTTCAVVCGDHACDPGETTSCPGDCP